MKRLFVVAVVLVFLTGCTASGTPTPTPTGGVSSTSTPGETGPAPSAEQISWAGEVCTGTTAVQADVQALATAASTGGADVGTAVAEQMNKISASVVSLADTVKSAPTGTENDPGYAAVRDSIDAVDQSMQTLQTSAAQVEGATGAALVTALGTVVVNTGTVLTDVAAAAQAIGAAMNNASSTVGQAFRAAPECAGVTTA